MSNSDNTPRRSMRIDDDLWKRCIKKAEFMSLSAVIRALLTAWVNDEIRVDATGKVTVGDATQTD